MNLKFACRISHPRNGGKAKCSTEKTTWLQVARNSLLQNSKKQRGKRQRITKPIFQRNQQQQSMNSQSSSKVLNNWQSCGQNKWILVFMREREGTQRSAKRCLSLLKVYHWRLRRKNFILMTCHYTDLGRSRSFCKGKFPQPIRSITQRYRYGIVSAPSSCRHLPGNQRWRCKKSAVFLSYITD